MKRHINLSMISCYDKSGYGSVNTTYLDAREKAKESNSSITMKYVMGWFSRNISKQRQASGQNRFVAPYPSYEF